MTEFQAMLQDLLDASELARNVFKTSQAINIASEDAAIQFIFERARQQKATGGLTCKFAMSNEEVIYAEGLANFKWKKVGSKYMGNWLTN
ncbi:hypothetical protein [Paenibacillus protaetiae]|uniref:Uncharacterized protein n=1 Tax=Paenibacillus protaetiae TaxID=2509456 RepID=A0A4P6ET68_9BACL|nr:hypothetical protein [Paenibacillus protaetiae]QAY66350.1 hypothetical protein ET464_07965 [Paenibacillus protaetiae]